MSASSYSSLIRRSKLSSFNPNIEQVYTTPSAHLSRSNFGLKRPLPSATTTVSPFVRVNALDTTSRRTDFRKGTKETTFVKKWTESGVGIKSVESDWVSSNNTFVQGTELQSRFVPALELEGGKDSEGKSKMVDAGGRIKSIEELKKDKVPQIPLNIFSMSDAEFESFLVKLGPRRDAFIQFLEQDRAAFDSSSSEPLDLYSHSRKSPNELIVLLNRFLSLPSFSSSSTLTPQPHPTLGLQYSSPTPLESSLHPPIPGRILGVRNVTQNRSQHPPTIASVMGQIVPVSNVGTSSSTTFFPDATGYRSNIPGKATFNLGTPEMRPLTFAMSVNASERRGRGRLNEPLIAPHYVPKVFHEYGGETLFSVKPEVSNDTPSPTPGTMEYSQKREPISRFASSNKSTPKGYGELMAMFPTSKGGRKQSYTKTERFNFRQSQEEMKKVRSEDGKWARPQSLRKRGGAEGKGKRENAQSAIEGLLKDLSGKE